jgi:hypothetical protein
MNPGIMRINITELYDLMKMLGQMVCDAKILMTTHQFGFTYNMDLE